MWVRPHSCMPCWMCPDDEWHYWSAHNDRMSQPQCRQSEVKITDLDKYPCHSALGSLHRMLGNHWQAHFPTHSSTCPTLFWQAQVIVDHPCCRVDISLSLPHDRWYNAGNTSTGLLKVEYHANDSVMKIH